MDPTASEPATQRFLEGLWLSFGVRVVQTISNVCGLNDEQKEALEEKLLKPNDWQVKHE